MEPELFRSIQLELKRTIRLFQAQLHREQPNERVFAIFFEVDVGGTYAIRVAGTEESLTRLAEKYIAKGYQVRSGDLLETLRTSLRWDVPGDDRVGWYWGDQEDDAVVAQLIDQAVQAGLIEKYGEIDHLRRLCLTALRELDGEGTFGTGQARERILIGTCCCEHGFGEAEDVEELAALNPEATIRRLLDELRAAVSADQLLIRPWECT